MCIFLDKDGIWKNLSEFSQAETNMKIAVAYIGKEALNFRWKKDDVLITDLTKENAINDAVDITVLEELIKMGVKVFRSEKLHSKIYFFKQAAIVGSANLSENSKKHLNEAAILIKEQTLLKEIEKYIDGLYDPKQPLKSHDLTDYGFPVTWILETSTDPNPNQSDIEKAVEKQKQSKVQADSEHWSLNYITKVGDQFRIKPNELVIIVHKNNNDVMIYPPRKCHDFTAADQILYLQHPHGMTSINELYLGSELRNILLQNLNKELEENKEFILKKFRNIHKNVTSY